MIQHFLSKVVFHGTKKSSPESKATAKIDIEKSFFGILAPDASLEQSKEERLRKRSIRSVMGVLKPKTCSNVDEAIDLARAKRAKEISDRIKENKQ